MVVGGSSGASTSRATEGVPLKHNRSTPFELWKDRKSSLKYFQVWGCLAKVLIPEHKRKKLGSKTVDVVILGYVETSYALRFLVIKLKTSSIEVNTIVEFHDVVFLEDVFPIKIGIPSSVSLDGSLASTSIPEHVEKISNVGVNPRSTSLTHEKSDEPRRSRRARVVKYFVSDIFTDNIEDDPITFKDAMASSEAKQWKEAAKSEMDYIVSNGTWVLAYLPPKCTTIGCKWIFKKKLKPNGTVDQFKLDWWLRDMGDVDLILGIKLIRSIDGIAVSQSHYVKKIIENIGYQNSRIAKTPYDSSVALFLNESGVLIA
ncbi:hypothetical protein Sango_2714100 [Sesamum angolense]|uniref:Retroviral polymerase SH3-like domain-containing protein n=1 Tax=Sesamum angolense TaxID=2727404 RepID=A0AAE1W365_9LAMI|nr:hypothetical protein Sango_2714100 [Sesamum angolense]